MSAPNGSGLGDHDLEVEVNYDMRMLLWRIYNMTYVRRAWSPLEDALYSTPIDFKQGNEKLNLTPGFARTVKDHWENWKIQCLHWKNVEGIVPVCLMKTKDGQTIPSVIDPETCNIFVRYNVMSEKVSYRVTRRGSRYRSASAACGGGNGSLMPYSGTPGNEHMSSLGSGGVFGGGRFDFEGMEAIRIDAGATYPAEYGGQDPTIYVLDEFGCGPTPSGEMRSIMMSVLRSVYEYETTLECYYANSNAARDVRLFAEAGGSSENSIKEAMLSRYVDAGSIHPQQMAENEQIARSPVLDAMRKIELENAQMQAGMSIGYNPSSIAPGFSPGNVWGSVGTYLTTHGIIPIPPNFTLKEVRPQTYAIDIESSYKRLERVIIESFGIPNSIYVAESSSRGLGSVELFQGRIKVTMDRVMGEISSALTKVYHSIYGGMHRDTVAIALFEKWLRPQMKSAIDQYMKDMVGIEEETTNTDGSDLDLRPLPDPSKKIIGKKRKKPDSELNPGVDLGDRVIYTRKPGPKTMKGVKNSNDAAKRLKPLVKYKKTYTTPSGLPMGDPSKQKKVAFNIASKKSPAKLAKKYRTDTPSGGNRHFSSRSVEVPFLSADGDREILNITPEELDLTMEEQLVEFINEGVLQEVSQFQNLTREAPEYGRWAKKSLAKISSAAYDNPTGITLVLKNQDTTPGGPTGIEETFTDFLAGIITSTEFVEAGRRRRGMRMSEMDEDQRKEVCSTLDSMRSKYMEAMLHKQIAAGPFSALEEHIDNSIGMMQSGMDLEKSKMENDRVKMKTQNLKGQRSDEKKAKPKPKKT